MKLRPDATTVKVALWPAVTVWFAGCALIERRLPAKPALTHPRFMIRSSAAMNVTAKRFAMLPWGLAMENKERKDGQQHSYQGLVFFKGHPQIGFCGRL